MSDKNYRSYADVDGVLIENESIVAPDDSYADIAKFSHAKNVVVRNVTIHGGKEDAIDMNRYCENIRIERVSLYSGGEYCATIKGGTKNTIFKDVQICQHGKSCDIDLGNWSDQSDEMTTGIVLENVYSLDDKPVSVRVLWAEVPQIIGGNVKLVVYPKWIVKIYRWLRKRKLVP